MPDSLLSKPPPLIGRVEALEQIAAARKRGAIGAVIEGPAGTGRSRVAREAVAAAAAGAARGEWVQATRSAAIIPLGAFAEFSSADELQARAGGRPVVVGVDDAQLLDPESAALVLRLAIEGVAFVIVTVPDGAPRPPAIEALRDDERVVRVPLTALDPDETGELAEAWLDGPFEVAALDWAYEQSRGNPRYLFELLRGALVEDALAREGGLWRLQRAPRPSRDLTELVLAQLAELGAAELLALELLALGEPLLPSEAVTLLGASALAAIEQQGLVTTTLGYRVAQPLHAEVLRGELPSSRARAARLQLAALISARDPFTSDDALRVARWLGEAGEEVPVPVLIDAATAAMRTGEPELAVQFAGTAAARGGGFAARIVQVRALVIRDRFEDAEQVLAAMEGGFASEDEAAAYLDQRVTVLYWGLKRRADAMALLDRAHSWWPGDAWQHRLEPLTALASGLGASLALTTELVESDGTEDEIRRGLEPLHAANLLVSGRAKEAYALALRIRPSVPIRSKRDGLALMAWTLIARETGEDWPELESWMWWAFGSAVRAGDEGAAGIAGLAIAGLRVQQVRYYDALRSLDEAERHLERHDPFGLHILSLAMRVSIALFTGDVPGAAAALAHCHEAAAGGESLATQRPYLVRAEAWAARAAGDPPRAQRILLDDAEASESGPGYAALAAYEALLAGAPARRVSAMLEELRERSDARLVGACADHALALARRDGKALLACADEMEAIGALRFAIECVVHAAEVFAQEGRQDSARRAAARSFDMLIPEQGGLPPTIGGLDSSSEVLTAREEQLVALVGRGLSNAEIAEQLDLSVRTVESHVYRAMRKLGVSDRRDLGRQHAR